MMKASVVGNLGRNAETKERAGNAVTSFSIASNTKVKGEERTTWVRGSIWGERGIKLAPHLTKGRRVLVYGELRPHEHEGQTYLDLIVSDVTFCDSRSGGSSSTPSPDDAEVSDPEWVAAPAAADPVALGPKPPF
jgi:single-stranded DNA-binding protein